MKPKHGKKALNMFEKVRRLLALIWHELTRKKDWFDMIEDEDNWM